jgi:hypothetical protein
MLSDSALGRGDGDAATEAERPMLDVDPELTADERDHLRLRASRMVDEVLGDRTGMLRAQAHLCMQEKIGCYARQDRLGGAMNL